MNEITVYIIRNYFVSSFLLNWKNGSSNIEVIRGEVNQRQVCGTYQKESIKIEKLKVVSLIIPSLSKDGIDITASHLPSLEIQM